MRRLLSANPVSPTRLQGAEVARSRLSFDEFISIVAVAGPVAQNAMYLAILTGQRIADIAKMQFKDIEDGYLHVNQKKSGSLVRLSLDLGLDCIDMTIGDAVSRCRDIVVSRYLLHHTKNQPRARKGGAIHTRSISKGFATARDKSGLKWDSPPNFHEMRSLSGRLYKDQGDIDVQNLLGHKDAKTTALYIDPRGSEWISVG